MSALPALIVAIFYFSLGIYVFKRGWQVLPRIRVLRILIKAIFLIASVCILSGLIIARTLPMGLSIFVKTVGGYWAISLMIFGFLFLLSDLLQVVKRFIPGVQTRCHNIDKTIMNIYPAFAFLAVLALLLQGHIHFIHPQTVTMDLSIDKHTPTHEISTIVAASDLHLGGVSGLTRLKDWVWLINRQQPDVIVFAGDLLDHDFNYKNSGNFVGALKKLKAKYGVYCILGNHEYYNDPQKAISLLENSGIRVLRDQAVTLDSSLVIIGRDDGTNNHRKLLDSLMNGLNMNLPVLLLDHQPIFDITPEKKIDLQISGHLHDGQIIPYNLILSILWKLSYGYKKMGNTHFYVTSGLGLRFIPLRLGTQSEIVKFHLITTN